MAAKTGRRTRLTKRVKSLILKGIKAGLTYERSAQLAGISQSTFYYWKQRGRTAKDGIYLEFLEALKKAEIEGELKSIEHIIEASESGTWQAAAWLLERRFPERWGRVQRLEVSWRNELMDLIKSGILTQDDIVDELGDDFAQELFESAGIRITQS